MPTRRQLLRGAATLFGAGAVRAARPAEDPALAIERHTLWNGRGGGPVWFHPRPCTLPGGADPAVGMTMQSISGSDVFGPVHWTRTEDLGRTWSDPVPIAAFGRRELEGGLVESVCDVVPQLHPQTGRVLAIGHNVYYRGGRLTQPYRDRFPLYAVGDGEGTWTERRKLEWEHPETSGIYTCGCGERLVLEDGELLIPISYGAAERRDRAVTTLRCAFDGEELRVLEAGSALRLAAGRGLLEPSLVRHGGRFLMTIRAEDGRGYSTISDDGLAWSELRPWRWQGGNALDMSTTQQHWLVVGGRLHLVYTRRDGTNDRVMRWRAPLYVAAVDGEGGALDRESEQVVFPLRGDPAEAPQHVARMGNFHTLAVTDEESWVTVGEARPTAGWGGDLLLARLRPAE